MHSFYCGAAHIYRSNWLHSVVCCPASGYEHLLLPAVHSGMGISVGSKYLSRPCVHNLVVSFQTAKRARSRCPSRINLRDSNPVRGDMFIESGATKHISSSVGAVYEIAAVGPYSTGGEQWSHLMQWVLYSLVSLGFVLRLMPITFPKEQSHVV